MNDAAHMLPDWVILGVDNGERGVVIYASTDLTEAELQVVYDESRHFGDALFSVRAEIAYVVMSTKMKTYLWVRGATYQDALRKLFEQWEPKRQERPAVDPQPALPRPAATQ